MAYQQVVVELIRDGPGTPWGFRMTGGADIGAPLVIQKVSYGSPSEGELQKGDIILKVRDKDASRLSHQVATDLIIKAGSTLRLVIARAGGQIPVLGTPTTTPLQPLLTPTNGPQSLFKPLPTTNFGTQRQRRSSVESYTSSTSGDTEKDLIVNQPFRSTPLILPSVKCTKDTPIGSYLRFDNLSKRNSTPPMVGLRLGDPYMLSKVQEAVIEAAQSSAYSSPGRTPTPDMGGNYNGPQVCIKQYNSPIHMYSNQAIVEALAAQSVMSRRPQDAGVLESKKMTNIQQSPTYQLLQEEEYKNNKVEEFQPLKEHVYNVQGTEFNKSDIQQSGSFKSIMHDLRGFSDF